jgi:hypothetical protein
LVVDATPLELDTDTGLFPDRPTKTQVVAELQLTELTADTEVETDWFAVHVLPPSTLDKTGAAAPWNAEPAASQAPLEHDSTSRVALPGGVATDLHVAPALVVTTSNAAADGSWATAGLAPIATQVVAEEHDTERSTPVPPLTVRAPQELPPLVLTRIEAPTDTQNVDVGQSTEPSAPTEEGSVGTFQVAPPLEESRSCPPRGPALPDDTPTLMHVEVVGQVTPSSVVLLVGMEYDVHVAPPSLDETVAP